ncbi:uncharacterized protein LOC108675123 [Hyalella azteca]|uniref:Uncharacterized protein LOC108675123 n=1 Tax=Hyalella azteca TaxID=294128 RepID=A0A8B7P0J3_HYAAZ|nr:uncharacterized protein LOC108675123 [Hyalella azteca]
MRLFLPLPKSLMKYLISIKKENRVSSHTTQDFNVSNSITVESRPTSENQTKITDSLVEIPEKTEIPFISFLKASRESFEWANNSTADYMLSDIENFIHDDILPNSTTVFSSDVHSARVPQPIPENKFHSNQFLQTGNASSSESSTLITMLEIGFENFGRSTEVRDDIPKSFINGSMYDFSTNYEITNESSATREKTAFSRTLGVTFSKDVSEDIFVNVTDMNDSSELVSDESYSAIESRGADSHVDLQSNHSTLGPASRRIESSFDTFSTPGSTNVYVSESDTRENQFISTFTPETDFTTTQDASNFKNHKENVISSGFFKSVTERDALNAGARSSGDLATSLPINVIHQLTSLSVDGVRQGITPAVQGMHSITRPPPIELTTRRQRRTMYVVVVHERPCDGICCKREHLTGKCRLALTCALLRFHLTTLKTMSCGTTYEATLGDVNLVQRSSWLPSHTRNLAPAVVSDHKQPGTLDLSSISISNNNGDEKILIDKQTSGTEDFQQHSHTFTDFIGIFPALMPEENNITSTVPPTGGASSETLVTATVPSLIHREILKKTHEIPGSDEVNDVVIPTFINDKYYGRKEIPIHVDIELSSMATKLESEVSSGAGGSGVSILPDSGILTLFETDFSDQAYVKNDTMPPYMMNDNDIIFVTETNSLNHMNATDPPFVINNTDTSYMLNDTDLEYKVNNSFSFNQMNITYPLLVNNTTTNNIATDSFMLNDTDSMIPNMTTVPDSESEEGEWDAYITDGVSIDYNYDDYTTDPEYDYYYDEPETKRHLVYKDQVWINGSGRSVELSEVESVVDEGGRRNSGRAMEGDAEWINEDDRRKPNIVMSSHTFDHALP